MLMTMIATVGFYCAMRLLMSKLRISTGGRWDERLMIPIGMCLVATSVSIILVHVGVCLTIIPLLIGVWWLMLMYLDISYHRDAWLTCGLLGSVVLWSIAQFCLLVVYLPHKQGWISLWKLMTFVTLTVLVYNSILRRYSMCKCRTIEAVPGRERVPALVAAIIVALLGAGMVDIFIR